MFFFLDYVADHMQNNHSSNKNMPPNPENIHVDHHQVIVFSSDEESSDEEEEDPPPPPPVTEETPFEFGRIQTRLAAILEHPGPESITYFDDELDMVYYTIEIRCNNSGMRKMIHSSGDVTYRRRWWPVDTFWDGVEAGVCESCQHVSGRDHPIWYKASERSYPEIDYSGRDRVIEGFPVYPGYHRSNMLYEVQKMPALRVLMRQNTLAVTLGEAIRRNKLHVDVMLDIFDKDIAHLTDTLASHHMEMPSSVKRMNQKEQLMRELFRSCICGKNKKEARVWKIKSHPQAAPMITITPPHISQEIMRERWVAVEGEVAREWPITTEVRLVQQPCACLCACGHRNTNYTGNE